MADARRNVVWRPLRRTWPVRCEDGSTQWAFVLDRETIGDPLRWRTPRDVTVADDPFARFVDPLDTAAIFAVMASAWSHFRVSTEHPETMRRWFGWIALGGASAVSIYNARHEIHCPPLAGRVAPPTPEVRYLYDVGAPRVSPYLRGRAAKRGDMGERHWQAWPLAHVDVEVRRG